MFGNGAWKDLLLVLYLRTESLCVWRYWSSHCFRRSRTEAALFTCFSSSMRFNPFEDLWLSTLDPHLRNTQETKAILIQPTRLLTRPVVEREKRREERLRQKSYTTQSKQVPPCPWMYWCYTTYQASVARDRSLLVIVWEMTRPGGYIEVSKQNDAI